MRQVIHMGDRESNPSQSVLETNSPALEHAPTLSGSLHPPDAGALQRSASRQRLVAGISLRHEKSLPQQ